MSSRKTVIKEITSRKNKLLINAIKLPLESLRVRGETEARPNSEDWFVRLAKRFSGLH